MSEDRESRFKPGDVVRLKSGGPLMTVHRIEPHEKEVGEEVVRTVRMHELASGGFEVAASSFSPWLLTRCRMPATPAGPTIVEPPG